MEPDDNFFTKNLSATYQVENNQIDLVAVPYELGLVRDSLEPTKVNAIYPFCIRECRLIHLSNL